MKVYRGLNYIEKPYLIVVTGRPGSGKTTFAQELSAEICMPLISRDQIKEGYVHTFGKSHIQLPQESNKIVTEIFFDTLNGLVTNNVSVIAEAAFQHGVWSRMLERFKGKARIYMLICKVDDRIALDRFVKRRLDTPSREYYHGDKIVGPDAIPYEEPHLDVPTFHIDTLGEYSPSIKALEKIILEQRE